MVRILGPIAWVCALPLPAPAFLWVARCGVWAISARSGFLLCISPGVVHFVIFVIIDLSWRRASVNPPSFLLQALVVKNEKEFTHILRVLNTNVDGRQKVIIAFRSIKGLGRRFSTLACKKADVDLSKRYVH